MLVFLLITVRLCALAASTDPPARRDVVVVTGSYEPVPLDESDRSVRAMAVTMEGSLLASSAADYLRLDPSLDLRSRAPNGVQSDLSIRGGSFGQTLVLLDGMRLNDAQSGHHNLDIPVPLESLERVEILKGAGSAQHGSDAMGGVVNLITRVPESSELRFRAAAGNFGVNRQSAVAGAVWRTLSQQFAVTRDFSTGFRPNRDYRNLSLSSVTRAGSRLGATRVILAHNDRPFGADRFYGDFPSWERTRTWFGSVRQELGERTDVSFAWRRHTDLFVLYRDRPQIYTNRHATESSQAILRRREVLAPNAMLSYGGEGYRDTIESTNLGARRRNRGAAWLALDVRALRRFSFTAGGREEFYSRGGRQFSPTVSGGFWASTAIKLRAGVSRAFRLPSYTDLYYHDPANLGSPDLRPERAWNYEAGLDWFAATGRIRGDVTVFHRRERDVIDYVRRSPGAIWRATNFQRIDFTGLEASIDLRPARGQSLDLRYTGLRGGRAATGGVESKYVFNYPVHHGLVHWNGNLPGGLLARARLGVLSRLGRDPYAVLDAGAAYVRGRVRPFLQLTNLGEATYQEIPGVAMPGRGITGGVEIVVFGAR